MKTAQNPTNPLHALLSAFKLHFHKHSRDFQITGKRRSTDQTFIKQVKLGSNKDTMKRPWYQKFFVSYIPWLLTGVAFAGSLLDVVSNSDLITPQVTWIGSAVVVLLALVAQILIVKRRIYWVTEDHHRVYVKAIGAGPVFVLIGLLISFWLPRWVQFPAVEYSVINTETPEPIAHTIRGQVLDNSGTPVNGINIAIYQYQGDKEIREDVESDDTGSFQVRVPTTGISIWHIGIVGVSCNSRVVNGSCLLTNYFESHNPETVAVPQTNPVIFRYEKATTVIKGTLLNNLGEPVGGMLIHAKRSDGAFSFSASSNTGYFELPASDGTWEVYAFESYPDIKTGPRVVLQISTNYLSDPITLLFP